MEYDIPSCSSLSAFISVSLTVISSYSISPYLLHLALLFLSTLSSSFMKIFQSCPNWSFSFSSFCTVIHLTYLNQIPFSKTLLQISLSII